MNSKKLHPDIEKGSIQLNTLGNTKTNNLGRIQPSFLTLGKNSKFHDDELQILQNCSFAGHFVMKK
jgi:hypothetical protein